jgi:DNA-directed RNA polymerase I, II, and III subunit RPABC1
MKSGLQSRMSIRFKELFKNRGYTLQEYKHVDDLKMDVYSGIDGDGDKIILLFNLTPKFNVRTAEICIDYIQENKGSRTIIVYKEVITCFARKVLDNLALNLVEHFPCKELEINILTHVMQPKKFVKVVGDEAAVILEKWGDSLPKMLTTDPVSRYLGFKNGDLIEIHRKNDIIVYRKVSTPV